MERLDDHLARLAEAVHREIGDDDGRTTTRSTEGAFHSGSARAR